MGSEQFSLCWDNFHRNMSSGMHSMLESEDLVDVTLAIEGQYLKAHKMVLSVCSPYFRKLFSMNPCKHPIFFMKDVSYEVMNDLLTFMYQGEVQVNQENLGNFIKTAEALQIRGLTNDSSEVEDVEGKAQKRPATDEFRSPNKSVKKVPAPVVKRPKLSAPVNNNPPGAVTPCILNTSLQRNSAQPGEGQEELKPPEVVQFKMEPYDAAEQCENYETDGQDGYTEEDSQLDEDYSTLESDEPKAGTSGDSIADTQETLADSKLIPAKSKYRYEKELQLFEKWEEENAVKCTSEEVVMEYVDALSEKFAPNSLSTKISMLKSSLLAKRGVDIGRYRKIDAYLRRNSLGYTPKKSKILSKDEVLQFLNDAPDEDYLFDKVVLIFGIFGACRRGELTFMKTKDIQDNGTVLIINIPKTKNYKKRTFCILEDHELNAMNLYRKYAALRPETTDHDRFFLCFKKGRCTRQPVGRNTIGGVCKKIAVFLGLDNPHLYTGHCLRRSSSTQLIGSVLLRR